MAVPTNIIVAWPSTAASIPTGWTRVTELDGRYILGASAAADADLTTDRGNTTHTHTSPSHTPTQNAHTHTVGTPGNDASDHVDGGASTGSFAAAFEHGHVNANSTSATGTNNGVAITVDATSNDLAYVEVIWIKSDGTPISLPTGCIAFFASDTLPSGWTRVHGNKYLKGAAASSDGGGTGGSNTHTHTSPAHTHTQNSHTHGSFNSGAGDIAGDRKGSTSSVSNLTSHVHTLSLLASTPTNQSVTTTINSGSHEPPFKKLNHIQAGSADLPDQVICLWGGTAASIPTNWSRFTGMDGQWCKAANADGESNSTTGGSAQHNHTASNCQPTQNAHTHTVNDGGPTTTTGLDIINFTQHSMSTHTHSDWQVSSEVATNNSVAVTIDDCTSGAAYPKHRTLIFIQFTESVGPTVSLGGYTSYDLNLFDIGDPFNAVPLETAQKVWSRKPQFSRR